MTHVRLGVCYYPEHWPRERWAEDATGMAALSLSLVRIGEFAWSRLEPEPGRFDWGWLDDVVETLAAAGLDIIMGTPTACPPHWLVARDPDVLPVGVDDRVRGFGSRRHYAFSSPSYREAARDITARMAERYGKHAAVVGWQIDNEFGCHDTTECFSPAALTAFQKWCEARYDTVDALNTAWGNVFWSQEYETFDAIGLPVAVTETNPAHRMAWRRFSSDQVRAFSADMAATVRAHAPDAWLTHNFMGDFTDFDHFDVGADYDVASWDSYPLGFLDLADLDDATKARYRRRGHPDWAAFHHDLYRAVGRGRFGVMEQQPGPVNWAPHNAQPAAGMARLWGWEAIAHGAEFVSWFRWRQLPVAQEQFHAGVLHADATPAPAHGDIERLARDLAGLELGDTEPARAALVFDYEACWVTDIQPQSAGFAALTLALEWYSAARQNGLDVDIVSPDAALDGYALVLLPCLPMLEGALLERIAASGARWLAGPRAGSRTQEFAIPDGLAPGPIRALADLRITGVDALRPGVHIGIDGGNDEDYVHHWLEAVESSTKPGLVTGDGRGVTYDGDGGTYVAARCSRPLLARLVAEAAQAAGLDTRPMPAGLRTRRRGNHVFAVNYGNTAQRLPAGVKLLLGQSPLPPGEVALWSA
ncbi:MAG: beta-galactosidase [Pseudomonadota bacterium]